MLDKILFGTPDHNDIEGVVVRVRELNTLPGIRCRWPFVNTSVLTKIIHANRNGILLLREYELGRDKIKTVM